MQSCEWLIHDVVTLCISTMWLFNFFMSQITLKQELQKWQKGPRGIRPLCPPPPSDYPAYPLHPSSFPPSPPHYHHSPTSPPNLPPSTPPSEFLEGLQALPTFLHGPVGQALGCLHTGLGSSYAKSKIMTGFKSFTSFKIVTWFKRH